MRMNSVPASQISPFQLKHSATLLYVITSAQALPTTAHAVQLVLLHRKKVPQGDEEQQFAPERLIPKAQVDN